MVLVVSRLADRRGPRYTLLIAGLALGVACFAMSVAKGPVAFFLAFAALRALGQGSLTINATLLAALWFVRQRGRAMAIMGLGFPLSVAILPPVSRALIEAIGWRETYMVLGIMVWLLVLPGAFFVVRDRPEVMGLHPDGADHPPIGEEAAPTHDDAPDRRRVFTSLTFWLLAIPLSTSALVSTGLIFHQTAIMAERGIDASIAASVFVPYALTSAVVSLFAGVLVDRYGPRRMFVLDMTLLLVAMLSLLLVSSWTTAVIYAVIHGAAGGITRIVSSVTWAHFYGRHRLGRVQGSAVMINITSSALGPIIFAVLEERFAGFEAAVVATAVLPVLSVVMISFARPAQPEAAPLAPAPPHDRRSR